MSKPTMSDKQQAGLVPNQIITVEKPLESSDQIFSVVFDTDKNEVIIRSEEKITISTVAEGTGRQPLYATVVDGDKILYNLQGVEVKLVCGGCEYSTAEQKVRRFNSCRCPAAKERSAARKKQLAL